MVPYGTLRGPFLQSLEIGNQKPEASGPMLSAARDHAQGSRKVTGRTTGRSIRRSSEAIINHRLSFIYM